ncbi:flagellar hook-length control protein FliK [Thiomicrorhabdus sp.]|uniref:flagellar hook-length control protein FliK n=1 Tax=Thiomicrorhabdus sp. TaxID=2039724 RepID=UPI00356647C8
MLEQVLSDSKPKGLVLQGSVGRQTLPEKGGFAALLESTLSSGEGSLPSLKGASSAVLSNLPFDSEAQGLTMASTRMPFVKVDGAFVDDSVLPQTAGTENAVLTLADLDNPGVLNASVLDDLEVAGSPETAGDANIKEIVAAMLSGGKLDPEAQDVAQTASAQNEVEAVSVLDEAAVSATSQTAGEPEPLIADQLDNEQEQQVISPILSDVSEESSVVDDVQVVADRATHKSFADYAAQRMPEHDSQKSDLDAETKSVTVDGEAQALSEELPVAGKPEHPIQARNQAHPEHPEHPEHPAHPEQARNFSSPAQFESKVRNAKHEELTSVAQMKPAVASDVNDSDADVAVNATEQDLSVSETVEEASMDELSKSAELDASPVDESIAPVAVDGAAEQVDPQEQVAAVSGQDLPEESIVASMNADDSAEVIASSVKAEAASSSHAAASGSAGNGHQAANRSPLTFEHPSQPQGQQAQNQQGQSQQNGQQGQGNQSQQQFAQMAQSFVQNMQASRQQAVERQAGIQFSVDGATSQTALDAETSNILLNTDRRPQLPHGLQSIGLPVAHQRWGQALGQRVVYMANNQIQQAQITLNPEKLGPVQIKLHVDRDQQVHVVMTAQHGTTREAMEAAMPRLKEMMEQAGIDLASVDVSDQRDFQQNASDDEKDGQAGSASTLTADAEADAATDESGMQTYSTDSLVDYYA